jgi:hypothetical protein
VDYETADATATDRSDYGTAVGRLSFAPGEESKSLALIITDDSYAEGEESLRLVLSLPEGGAALGQNSEAEVALADNDRADGAVNPLDDSHFFVRQQFVDLLGREPGADESAARSAKTDRDLVNSLRAGAGLAAGDAARLVGEPTLKGQTRAELLTSVVGRDEVREKLRAESLVLIHYFTFLRRDPEDEGRRAWSAAAGDVLNLVSGFINSSEYRQRFGR